jgi:hypothetical protein
VILPGIFSFVESCVKSHWLCVPFTLRGEIQLHVVLCQVHQSCVFCHVHPLLVDVLLFHVSPHLPYLMCKWGLTTPGRDIRQNDDLARYSYNK